MAKVRFKIKEEIRIRVASNQSILLRSLLMPTTMATLTGTVRPILGMAFGIPPYIKKWLLPEKSEEEGEAVRLSDRKVVNSEVDAVGYDRYSYWPPFLWKNILI